MNIYIYQKNSLLIGVIAPSIEEFNANPSKFYPHIPEGQFVTSEFKYDYPLIESGIVRNKTRDERILLDNETSLLNQGEYVESNQIKFKECPTNLYKPKWVTPNWIEGATLEECKLIKRDELKQQRDISTIQPYEYKGVMYQADLISQDKFFKSLLLNETDIHWIALDNTTHLLTHEDFELIVNGLKEREKQSFVKFNTLYIQILLCETIDEIKVIVW